MNLRMKLTAAATLLLLAAPAFTTASAFPFGKKKPQQVDSQHKPNAAQNALIDKSIVREAAIIKTLKDRTPIVETYVQNMRPDPIMQQVPDNDIHYLGRVNFGKVINDTPYAADKRDDTSGKKSKFGLSNITKSLSFLGGLSASLHLRFNEAGFVQMLLVDSKDYNRQTYTFSFVRNDFLGTIPTVVFDVTPVKKDARGRFEGRVWIERNNGNIVRFNGSFAGSDSEDIKDFYHFDSWRTNLQEGLWLPTSFYVEETDPKSPTHVLKFKAINHIWGYALKVPQHDADQTSVEVVGAKDESADAPDVGPLQAQREWVQQAEDNVIDRLAKAGLIDAPSEFDKTLESLANNILIYNQIQTSRPLKVRTLLTQPLESLAIGNTILLSKSLIDTTAVPTSDGAQQIGNLNCVLAFQIAHILLGHHIDTKYAFNDRLLFPDETAFARLPMQHTDEDNAAAAKKAIDLLAVKDLADSPQYFGLYLQQLSARAKGLKALNLPQVGDSLMKPDGTFWMQALVSKGAKLNNTDLKQQAAMPLGAFLKFDPWTDQVIQLHTSFEPLLGAPDKMPFEVTPVYLKLSYYKAPADVAPAATPAAPTDGTAAPAATTAPAADGTAAPATTAPATTAPPQQ